MRIDKNTTIRLGNRNIVKIKIGDSVIWQKTTEPVEGPDYFYIESLGDGNTISVVNEGNGNTDNVTPTLEYSTDKNTWNTITFDWASGRHTTELPIKLNTGGKMYFRNDTRKFSTFFTRYIKFSSSVSSNVGGDIRTLSNYLDVNSETTAQSYMFYGLFYNNRKIVDASNLRLPYTTLTINCYHSIFSGCTSLVNAPELPATTLVVNCYRNIFYDCTSLNNVTVYANDISADYCTYDWLKNVASSGTFNNMGFAPFSKGESGIPYGWTEVTPEIQSITANPDTFTIKSYESSVKCTSTLTIATTLGTTVTNTNTATITVGENTGDSTRTLTETIPYRSSSYQITIVQTANDVKPPLSWNVVSTGAYPFELNSNGYYESTNKGYDNSYSYATLNYQGFENLVLKCINSGELGCDYGIISQPDVLLSESTSDDGVTGSSNVFYNFNADSSTNPVQLTIPSDGGSHFITIKYKKDGSGNEGNDSLQFKVIEP